jgi:hypothetical protein
LGIIGGLLALIFGVFGYALGSIADVVEAGAGTFLKFLSLGLPIAVLVGAGIVINKPINGTVLMGLAAVGLLLILGFNFFTLFPVVLLGLGALLGFLGSQQDTK